MSTMAFFTTVVYSEASPRSSCRRFMASLARIQRACNDMRLLVSAISCRMRFIRLQSSGNSLSSSPCNFSNAGSACSLDMILLYLTYASGMVSGDFSLPVTNEHTLNIRPPLWLPIVIAVLLGAGYIGGKFVETRDQEKLVINVSGEGRVFAPPDIAEASFGVQTGRVETAKVAMEKLRRDMDAIFRAVKGLGVEEKDI